jgi:MFS family permease
MYGVVWASCVSGDQVRAFARMLGFNDFAFGVMGALPFIATVGQLGAAVTIEQTGLRKYHFMIHATLHRLLWVAVAAVPLVLAPGTVAVAAVLVLMGATHYLGAVSVPAWTTWMGDLIPRRIRGRYFARRAQWSQAVQIVVVIAIGIALDWAAVSGRPETISDQPALVWLICGVFAIGAVFGVIDILMFFKVREVVPPQQLSTSTVREASSSAPGRLARSVEVVRELLLEPLRDRVFRNYVGYGATLTFTMAVAGWYFWRYSTEGLGFSRLGTNALFMVIGPLSGTLMAGWWGRLQDRWGRRPVLIVCTVGATISMLPWFFTSRGLATPGFLVAGLNSIGGAVGRLLGHGDWRWVTPQTPVVAYALASLGCIIGGSSWTGVGLAQTGVVLGFCDGPGRGKYVAASAVLVSAGGAIGGLVGGVITQSLDYLQAHPLQAGPFLWTNWHATFVVAVVGRLLSLLWLAGMPDPGSSRVRDMLRHYTAGIYEGLQMRLRHPFRFLLGLSRANRHPSDKDGDRA